MTCEECMEGAPFRWCCKTECGEHEFCRNCQYPSRNETCPKNKIFNHTDKKEMK